MSEKNNLSINEIIKRAEEIKAEAERQLKTAQENLDKKAQDLIEDVVVDEKKIVEKIAKAVENTEDEDIKEYVPQKKKNEELIENTEYNEDVKIAENTKIKKFDETKKIELSDTTPTDKAGTVEKKQSTAIVPDLNKTKISFSQKRKSKADETKPVIISTNAEIDEKSDLQAIPTIISHEQIFDSFDESMEEEIGVQITFDGFDDKIEEVPTIDEEVAEELLKKNRQEKIGKFRLFGPSETDKELGRSRFVKDDYVKKSDKDKFLENLLSKKAAMQIKIIISLVLTFFLLLLTLFKDNAHFPVLLSSHNAYFITSIVLYIAVIAVNFNVIIHGFNIKKSLNSDFSISISALLILAHTFALLLNENLLIDNGVVLTSIGAVSLILSQLGKHRMLLRIIDNFEFISSEKNTHTVENIANAVDAGVISRGLIDEKEPIIKTSVKTDFPTNFLEISCKNEPSDKLSKNIFLITIVLNIALLLFLGFKDNFNSAVNMAICGLSISLPASALFFSNFILSDVSSSLDKYHARVCGFEGAAMADEANAMVMEAADLFGKDSCDIHGIKTFNGAKVDDAIIQAAAVIIQTKSPLAHAFDDVIIGKQSILPKVEGIQYEDKLGTSAWIYRRKVLVGNRDLLIHHGVKVPNESFEKRHAVKGRNALYLAVNGKAIAMFVVSYSADADLKRELKKLEKSGITIIVKSSDPYINEESIADLFSLPDGFIRIMNHSSARVYDKYSNLNVEKSPSYLVHSGSALGFVSAMRAAKSIISTKNIISFLTYFGSIIGFSAVALLSVTGTYSQITALSILSFQIIWILFTLIITKLKGLSL